MNVTQLDKDNYPLYKRRSPENNGNTFLLGSRQIDNRWVVPYNPWLLR